VSLPALLEGAEALVAPLGVLLELPPTPTAMARAASRSPMFDAWMATARRAPDGARPAAASIAREPSTRGPFDALVCVHASPPAAGEELALRRLGERLSPLPVHVLWHGETPAGAAPVWAHVPAHAPRGCGRLPLSSLDPEHAVARLYEGLAQALLAGLGSRGGVRAGDSNLP
jgi:hypothetical protein